MDEIRPGWETALLEAPAKSAPEACRVLVVASSPLLREGIIAALQEVGASGPPGQEGHALEAVASLADAQQVLIRAQPPLSVVALDPPLPDGSAAEACAQLIGAHPDTATLVLVGDPTHAQLASRNGARGVWTTDLEPATLRSALRRIEAGQFVLAPALLPALTGAAPSEPDEGLSSRELLALQLVARGYTSKQIAPLLGTSPKAVDLTLNRAAKRLGAQHRPEAVARAIRRGLID